MRRVVDLVNDLARKLAHVPHVLVVEDDPCDRELMARALCIFKASIEFAANAQEAKEAIQRHLFIAPEYPFDLVLLDLKLVGGPDGTSVMQYLYQVAPKVPVIVITGYPSGEMIERAARLGYFGLVAKPLEVESVEAILQRHKIPYCKHIHEHHEETPS